MPLFHQRLSAPEPYAVSAPAIAPAAARHRPRSLIDLVLPEYHYRGMRKISIDADPLHIMQALETVTLAEMPLAYAIGSPRYLPDRLLGRQRPPDDQLTRPFLDVAMPLRLGEDPGREIVIGAVGKFHNLLDQQFVDLPDLFTFTRFNAPGYQKLAMTFRVVPEQGNQRNTLVSEHRTLALSSASRWKFAVYWYLMVGWGGNIMLQVLLNAVQRRAERQQGERRSFTGK